MRETRARRVSRTIRAAGRGVVDGLCAGVLAGGSLGGAPASLGSACQSGDSSSDGASVSRRSAAAASRIHRSLLTLSSRVNTTAPLPSGAQAGPSSWTSLTVSRCWSLPSAAIVQSSIVA